MPRVNLNQVNFEDGKFNLKSNSAKPKSNKKKMDVRNFDKKYK